MSDCMENCSDLRIHDDSIARENIFTNKVFIYYMINYVNKLFILQTNSRVNVNT